MAKLTYAMIGALAVGFCGGLWGQSKYRLGVETSPQLNWLFNADDDLYEEWRRETTPGISAGITVTYQKSPKWGILFGISYNTMGQRYAVTPDSAASFKRELRLTWLKVPILYQRHFPLDPKTSLVFSAGPQLNLLVGARDEINDEDIFLNSDTRANEAYQGLDWSVVGTAGLVFKLGRSENMVLRTGVKFDVGITDIDNKVLSWRPLDESGRQVLNPVPFYDNFYGDNQPRRAATRQFSVGIYVGWAIYLDKPRDPNDPNW